MAGGIPWRRWGSRAELRRRRGAQPAPSAPRRRPSALTLWPLRFEGPDTGGYGAVQHMMLLLKGTGDVEVRVWWFRRGTKGRAVAQRTFGAVASCGGRRVEGRVSSVFDLASFSRQVPRDKISLRLMQVSRVHVSRPCDGQPLALHMLDAGALPGSYGTTLASLQYLGTIRPLLVGSRFQVPRNRRLRSPRRAICRSSPPTIQRFRSGTGQAHFSFFWSLASTYGIENIILHTVNGEVLCVQPRPNAIVFAAQCSSPRPYFSCRLLPPARHDHRPREFPALALVFVVQVFYQGLLHLVLVLKLSSRLVLPK